MFVTTLGAKRFMQNAEDNTEDMQHWSYTHLLHDKPWYLTVFHQLGMDEPYERSTILLTEPEQLANFAKGETLKIDWVSLVIPFRVNGVDQWGLHSLDEVWCGVRGAEGLTVIHVTEGGQTYSYNEFEQDRFDTPRLIYRRNNYVVDQGCSWRKCSCPPSFGLECFK